MLNYYTLKGRKKLRYGYSTGTCAAGAAKASALMLFSGEKISEVSLLTPKGWTVTLPLEDICIEADYAVCSVKKDSGDDPDVTDGIKIYAKVEKLERNEIIITGGTGIGRVTKKGLSVEVGHYAINPVPMKMIESCVREVLPAGEGVKVEIFAPEGLKISEKTLNSKLGIEGGISILGTSGIVEPVSDEAIKESMSLEISILKEEGVRKLIFVPGNYGEDFVKDTLHLKETFIVKTGNFTGFMLEKAVEYGMEEVLLVGHIGKLIKLAGGIFYTHNRTADGRMEILASNCALMGASTELVRKIMESNTTDEAVRYIKEYHMDGVFTLLADKISRKSADYVWKQLKTGTIIFSRDFGLLGICSCGSILMEEFLEETAR